ncbi:MAG: protein translocase subunit SecF [candidate division WOR-3 bacterium]
MRLIGETNIQFVARRRLFFVISGILVLASVAVIVLKGGFNYGVDFTGGSLLQVRFERPVSTDAVRGALAAAGEAGAAIQRDEFGDFLIRVKPKAGSVSTGLSERVRRQFEQTLTGNSFEILREETVGPHISKELQGKVLLAVIIGMIGILIYVSFRFDLRFGTGAVLALIHDTVITLGLVALFNREMTITTIAALLTMIGYSVNDTIVVSDRIREDIKKMRREKFADLVNLATNQVLTRTIVTGLTTLFVTLSLLLLGAAAIRDFAFVMTVGIVVGTYSSVFVVANFVVEWEQRFPSKQRR